MKRNNFWRGKRVFVTGHTGFKGAWLCLWLNSLGAKVTGYSLEPPTEPNLFELARIGKLVDSKTGDVRDLTALQKALRKARPQIVFHLAAQPIVRESYKVPVDTFSTNVTGTVNVLEAARGCSSVKAIINVTTDKVYENSNKKQVVRSKGFSEIDPLGGYDPYSSSKACSELVSQAYRRSYGLNIATARAGNVIGGGDWGADRLMPDFVRAVLKGKKIVIRNPKAVRPWQYVLEPLRGYLLLAQKLYRGGQKYAQAWNFGPDDNDAKTVEWIAKKLCSKWGQGASYSIGRRPQLHEAHCLTLDNKKAKKLLGWRPKLGLEETLDRIVIWNRAYQAGENMRRVCLEEIEEYNGI